MLSYEMLQIIWFALIGVLFVGYSILDGFDLGVGILTPFLAKNDRETGALYNSIGPVWDGNEVWLITAGGALFAAFPHVYATVFSGFYLALILLLCALILRAVSLEFWSLDSNNKKIWKIVFACGSFLSSLLFGIALGNVILGIPMNEKMDFTGDFFTLLRPFPLAAGILGLCNILLQGATYASVKTFEDIRSRSQNIAGRIWYVYAFAFIITLITGLVSMPAERSNVAAWVITFIFFILLIFLKVALHKGKDLHAFILSSLSFASLWGITGALQFPALTKSSIDTIPHLTIYNASSTEMTLRIMLIIALIGMPLVIGYTAYVYRIFKGKTG